MKRLAIAALVLIVLVAGISTAAYLLVDVNKLSQMAQQEASKALGQPVSLGEVGLKLLPPALRVRNVKVGGAKGPALAEVQEVRLGVAIAPLFAGKVVLSALEIEGPRIHLDVDKDGKPIIPQLGAPAEPGAPAPAPAPGGEGGGASSAPPALAIQRIAISKGHIEVGPWLVDPLDVSGTLALGGTGSFTIDAGLGELGSVQDLKVELSGIGGPALAAEAKGSLRDLNLKLLNERLALVKPADGRLVGLLGGTFSAKVRGSDVEAAQAELAAKKLDVKFGDITLAGDVPVRVELGKSFSVDLSAAALGVAEALRKPAGDKLLISGPLGATATPAALKHVDLVIGPNTLSVDVDLAGKRPHVVLQPATFQIEPLRAWLVGDLPQVKGAIAFEKLDVRTDPIELNGGFALRDVSVQLEHGPVLLNGPVKATGSRIVAQPLTVGLGPEKLAISASYDLAASALQFGANMKDANVANLGQALAGSQQVTGTLGASMALAGKPSLDGLAGGGEFAITQGQIKGFSLAKQLFGQLADVAQLALQARGKDLSRYEQEAFESLDGKFQLANSRVHVEPLRLVYRGVRAELAGDIALPDGALNLAGKIVVAGQVDQELGGGGQDREIQGVSIACNLAKPCLRVDRGTLMRFAALYSIGGGRLGDKLGDKLDKKLGKEGADAVRGVLGGLLGGKPTPPPPPPDKTNP